MNIVSESAYISAEKFAKMHYENFPVVSFLINKKLRKHVAILYWFARTADDIADNLNFTDSEKIKQLNNFEDRLTSLLNGHYENNYELALYNTITLMHLTPGLFYDLITAFRQDLIKKRYQTFDELLNYCKCSANPVGRLILELHNIRDDQAFNYSDKICTALQLINFYQDVRNDLYLKRIYFPQDEMNSFSVTENMFELNKINDNLQKLVKLNIDRADSIIEEGKKLLEFLPGKLKIEIKWTILGGHQILERIKKNSFDIFTRAKLNKFDFLILFLKSII
ncbi:MAG: squalene synthase HpnC [Ignavibacteriaceae bacterium]|nr:squalene synthase HpnC [Ignavibacteriaceae bacterium]